MPIEAFSEDCPKKAIDAEVAKITDERRCTSDNPCAAGDVLDAISGDVDREERVEV
jgi:hypothetical protein